MDDQELANRVFDALPATHRISASVILGALSMPSSSGSPQHLYDNSKCCLDRFRGEIAGDKSIAREQQATTERFKRELEQLVLKDKLLRSLFSAVSSTIPLDVAGMITHNRSCGMKVKSPISRLPL